MKTIERDEARRLRREQGPSVKQIERFLGVARSSVSLWDRAVDVLAAPRPSALRLFCFERPEWLG